MSLKRGCCGDSPNSCYRLTNIRKPSEIINTSQDLSIFSGKVVSIEGFEGCWAVEISNDSCQDTEYEYDLVVDISNCYPIISGYRLESCDDTTTELITDTDLSAYFGSIINIENYDQYWKIFQYDITDENIVEVSVVEDIEKCPSKCSCCNRCKCK